MTILVYTSTTNYFMTSAFARRLKVEVEVEVKVEDTASSVKVNFAQVSCQVLQVAKDVRYGEIRGRLHDLQCRWRRLSVEKYFFTLIRGRN